MCLLVHQKSNSFQTKVFLLEKRFLLIENFMPIFLFIQDKRQKFKAGRKNHAKSSTFYMLTTSTFPISFAILFTTIFKRRMLLLPKCCVDNSPQMRLWQTWFLGKNQKKEQAEIYHERKLFYLVDFTLRWGQNQMYSKSSLTVQFKLFFQMYLC